MAESPRVSFIIPCHHSLPTLEQTLRSIFDQQAGDSFQVLRVESGWQAPDPPEALFGEKILWKRRSLGPAEARNWGVSQAESPLLAFVDSDVVLRPDWLNQMYRSLQSQETELVGAAIGNRNPETGASRALHLIEFSDFLPGTPSGFRYALSSSNCLLRRELFLEMGGFDTAFFMAEDLEFCSRLPVRPFFVSETEVAHKHRDNWPDVVQHLRHLGFWSGRFRFQNRTVSGGWLARFPAASVGLLPLRYLRINRRWARAQLPADYDWVRDQGGLAQGLWHWVRGFRAGVSGKQSFCPV